MELIVETTGSVRCIYNEEVDLSQLGNVAIRRASHVEPNDRGQWLADLSPCDGPTLGPFEFRSDALRAETDWLTANWLLKPDTGV